MEEEQSGKEKAEYGEEILQNFSKELTEEFGKGYSYRTLEKLINEIERQKILFASKKNNEVEH